jgi:polysaccharide biosynthesis/export protein
LHKPAHALENPALGGATERLPPRDPTEKYVRSRLATAILLTGLAGCAQSYGGIDPNAAAVQTASELPPPDYSSLRPNASVYRIGPYDLISIQFFGVENLNREGPVDASGTFSLPLIGSVEAAGKTVSELENEIENAMRDRYLRDPQVTVNVREVRSQRITLDGAITNPGIYPVLGELSLIQAIALGRGPSEFANIDRVAVFRTVNNQRMAAVFSLRDIREGRLSDPAIFGNDVIVVGESGGRRTFREILQVIPALGVFVPLATN